MPSAEAGIAVFTIGFECGTSETEKREIAPLMRETLDELKAMTTSSGMPRQAPQYRADPSDTPQSASSGPNQTVPGERSAGGGLGQGVDVQARGERVRAE